MEFDFDTGDEILTVVVHDYTPATPDIINGPPDDWTLGDDEEIDFDVLLDGAPVTLSSAQEEKVLDMIRRRW